MNPLPLIALVFMKKILVKLFLIIFLVFLIWPLTTSAVDSVNPLANLKGATPDLLQKGNIYQVTGQVVQGVLGFIGVLFIVMIIYGGFVWMTAGGDSGKVQKAKDTIIKATIGIVIILSSYIIVFYIISKLYQQT